MSDAHERIESLIFAHPLPWKMFRTARGCGRIVDAGGFPVIGNLAGFFPTEVTAIEAMVEAINERQVANLSHKERQVGNLSHGERPVGSLSHAERPVGNRSHNHSERPVANRSHRAEGGEA